MIFPPARQEYEMLTRNLHQARAQWKEAMEGASASIDPARVRAAVKEHPVATALIVAAAGYLGVQLLRLPVVKGAARVAIGIAAKAVLKNIPGM
ncbi:hypothetical protein IT570_12555 [Candidatus Sumerlaeota bacterium]|nr:hypothetical protein [Candidatus Sumerlaeota bacterium]